MVATSDLKVYKGDGDVTGFLGGGASGNQIISANPNNIFKNIPKDELSAGEDYYAGVFFKNTHDTENMDNFTLWLSTKSFPRDTQLKWGFDPSTVRGVPYLSFDGVDDYVNAGNDSSLWSQSLTKFSLSFWIYPTVAWDISRDVISHGGTAAQTFRVIIPTTTGRIAFEVRDAAGTNHQAYSESLVLNKWNFVACVYNSTLGGDNVQIYVDSVLSEFAADCSEAINSSSELRLSNSGSDFQGYMKDFRWWTDAIGSSQVAQVFDLDDDPLPDYWLPMKEGTGNPADEISEGVKTGTLTGGTDWINVGRMQEIPDKYTTPSGVDWTEVGDKPTEPNGGTLKVDEALPVWLWLHVDADAEERLDDNAVFTFKFDIPQGGTGTPGEPGGGDDGGTGGNPPPAVVDYKVAVVGDEGCESETDDVIDLILDQDYDHVVSVGDHAYESCSDSQDCCWIKKFTPLKSIMESAFGNHEYSESGGISKYMSFFGYSKTYFSYKFANIEFFVIDTNINCDVGSAQHTKIKSLLEASQTDNTVTWRCAVLHHPQFGADSDHDYNEANTVGNFGSLFLTNKVNFVFAGHNHNFQRTKQVIYNQSNKTSPTVVQSTGPYSRTKTAIIHVISGTGGHDDAGHLYPLDSSPGFNAYQNRTHNGVWEMVSTNSGNTLTCKFRDTSGNTYDSFVINA